jgi:sterol desaturase/sphingolipid hydroxylase (fatty acid hydroxylase superfamily)
MLSFFFEKEFDVNRRKKESKETTMATTTTIASWITIPSSSLTRGFVNSSLAVLLTIVLEVASFPHVQKLLALKGGHELYRSAIWTNVRNNLFLGPLTYYLTIEHVCSSPSDTAPSLTIMDRIISVAGILLIEGALYYYLHKCFHEVKSLYWIHRNAFITLAFYR